MNDGIRENLIDDDKNNEISETKYNRFPLKEDINFVDDLDNFVDHRNEINSKEDYTIKNSTFNWEYHFYSREGFTIKNIQDIIEKIDRTNNDKRNNVLIIYVNSITEIYSTIDIFKSINKEFHPQFLFIMKNKEKDSAIDMIYEDIKNYIYKQNKNEQFEEYYY